MNIIEKMARILAYYTKYGTMCEETLDFPFTDNKEGFIEDTKKFLDIYLSSLTEGTTGILDNDTRCDLIDSVMELHPKLSVKIQNTLINLVEQTSILQKALCDIELEKARQVMLASEVPLNRARNITKRRLQKGGQIKEKI